MLSFIIFALHRDMVHFTFKYISCYLLSKRMPPEYVLSLLFKYISCYLLSQNRPYKAQRMQYLNTSHVIFYLGSINPYPEEVLNLNTSHVIFYHRQNLAFRRPSIFKYISCYLLSYWSFAANHLEFEFKYISCYLLSA